jgi:hypothetical protein
MKLLLIILAITLIGCKTTAEKSESQKLFESKKFNRSEFRNE